MDKPSDHRRPRNPFLQIKNFVLAGVWIVVCVGCLSQQSVQMKRARLLAQAGRHQAAFELFSQIGEEASEQSNVEVATQSLSEAARIAQYELKNFQAAVKLYQQFILIETDSREVREAQIKIADIYFYDLQIFEKALAAYSKLLELEPTAKETMTWKNRIVRSYYYLGQFDQAEIELDELLKLQLDQNDRYQAELLRANIFTAAKKFDKASEVLSAMIMNYPEQARADSIPLMLAVSFEEQRDFKNAISVLEHVRDSDSRKSFIDEKLRSLKERMAQAPGARGLKK